MYNVSPLKKNNIVNIDNFYIVPFEKFNEKKSWTAYKNKKEKKKQEKKQ